MRADGWSLDDKRQPLLTDDKLGPTPTAALTEAEAAKNDLPDLVRRWAARDGTERDRLRTAQSADDAIDAATAGELEDSADLVPVDAPVEGVSWRSQSEAP